MEYCWSIAYIKTSPHINISSKNDFQETEKISTSQKNTESSASWRELIPVLDDAKNLFEERELIIGPETSSEEFNQAIQKLSESLEFDVETLSEVLKPNNDFKDKLWSTLFEKFDHKNPRPYIACLLAFFYKKLIHIYLYSSKRDMIFIRQLYHTLSLDFIPKNTPLKKKITQLFKNKEKFTSEEMDTFREIESMGTREATKKVVDNTRRLIKIFMDNFSTTQALLEALSEWVKNKELFQKHSKPELESYLKYENENEALLAFHNRPGSLWLEFHVFQDPITQQQPPSPFEKTKFLRQKHFYKIEAHLDNHL